LGELAKGVKLGCYDETNTNKKHNVLDVLLRGEEIATLELGGVRDLSKTAKGLGRDAAMLQSWLSKIAWKGDRMCYDGPVDGRWSRGPKQPASKQGPRALQRAKAVLEAEDGSALDYADLIARIKQEGG